MTSSVVLLASKLSRFDIHELTLPPPQPCVTFHLSSREKFDRKSRLALQGYRRIVVAVCVELGCRACREPTALVSFSSAPLLFRQQERLYAHTRRILICQWSYLDPLPFRHEESPLPQLFVQAPKLFIPNGSQRMAIIDAGCMKCSLKSWRRGALLQL
jgi:hypothetical protein